MTAEALLTLEVEPMRSSVTEPALLAVIRAARDGDERAFEEIMLASERRVALLAWRILGDAEEVKEATQETFLRVFRHLSRFDDQLDFFGWLFRIAVNVCHDIEKRRRRRWIFAPADEGMSVASDARAADDVLAARDDAALLTRAIDALPAKERLAFILREVQELSRRSLTDEGVDISGSRTIDGATNQFAIVLVDARSGDRTVLWDRHPGLTIDPADVPRAIVTSARILIVDCHETAAAAEAARQARAAGLTTVIDVEKVRPGIGDLLQHIDAVIAAESFPRELTGYEDLGRALEALQREFQAPLVAVTLGGRGSLARCGGREIRTRAFPVACVDTTGAGDAFRGGFAAAVLRAPDGDVEDALIYANAVAALNCRGLGARGGLPTPSEVDQLLMHARP